MKKLLCIIGQLGCGGSEKQLFLLLKHLDKEAWRPFVIVGSTAYKNSNYHNKIAEMGIPVFYLRGTRVLKVLIYIFLLLQIRPQKIMSWSFYMNAFASFSFGIDFIGALRGSLEIARKELSTANFAKSLAVKKFIVNSSELREQLIAQGKNAESVAVVPNIFERKYSLMSSEDFSEFRKSLRSKLCIDDKTVVIAGAGRDSPEKDFPFFLDVVEKLIAEIPNVRVLLAGICVRFFRREIRGKKTEERFILCGDTENAHDFLPAADIFFLSSKNEGMPNILLEAIDSGCIPVAMDLGGVREILGDSEFIVKGERDAGRTAGFIGNIIQYKDFRNKSKKIDLDRFLPERVVPEYISQISGVQDY